MVQQTTNQKYQQIKAKIGKLSALTEYLYDAYTIYVKSGLKFDPLETETSLLLALENDQEQFLYDAPNGFTVN